MNQNLKGLKLGLGAAVLASLLTACPGPRVYDPGVTLKFTLPEGTIGEPLSIQAMYTTRDEAGKVVMKPLTGGMGYSYFNGRDGSITLSKADLDRVLADKDCLPYRADKVNRVTEPNTVRSCDINFFVYAGANGPAAPNAANLRYLTHDTYSYASEAFTYTSALSVDGVTSTETGTRRAGWSLVPHLVLNPSATPNTYRVIRDSAEDSHLNLPLTLHTPSDYFTSMSVTTGGAR